MCLQKDFELFLKVIHKINVEQLQNERAVQKT